MYLCLVKNDKCQAEPQDEEMQHEDNESEESQEEETNTTNISCKTCNETFKNRKDLTVHLKTHTKGAKKPYSCELCCANFKRSSHLTRHKLIHTGEKPYSCPKCDKSFSRLDKLKQHTRNTHHSNSVSLIADDLKKVLKLFGYKNTRNISVIIFIAEAAFSNSCN